MASSTPGLSAGGRLAMVSRSTCSTDADERLPTSASDRQVSSRASGRRVQRRGDRLDHLGAAGMTHPCADVADLEVMGRKEFRHVVGQVAFDYRRDVERHLSDDVMGFLASHDLEISKVHG